MLRWLYNKKGHHENNSLSNNLDVAMSLSDWLFDDVPYGMYQEDAVQILGDKSAIVQAFKDAGYMTGEEWHKRLEQALVSITEDGPPFATTAAKVQYEAISAVFLAAAKDMVK